MSDILTARAARWCEAAGIPPPHDVEQMENGVAMSYEPNPGDYVKDCMGCLGIVEVVSLNDGKTLLRAREEFPGPSYQWWTRTDGLRLDPPASAPPPADETVTNAKGGKQSRLPFHPSRFPHSVWLAILVVLEQGAAKYDATPGEQNWRKISAAEHVDHARAHIYLWLDGDRSEPHLIHAICRLAFAAAMMMDEKETKE